MLKGASPFGLRECSVVLVDIFASYKRAKSASVEGITQFLLHSNALHLLNGLFPLKEPDKELEKMTPTTPFITTGCLPLKKKEFFTLY